MFSEELLGRCKLATLKEFVFACEDFLGPSLGLPAALCVHARLTTRDPPLTCAQAIACVISVLTVGMYVYISISDLENARRVHDFKVLA
jgi:hypothetical protein